MKRVAGIRFFFLIGTTTLAFLFIGFNVYQLQIGSGEYYAQKAHAYNSASEAFAARRGSIFFKDKGGVDVPAAVTKDYPLVFAVPIEIADPAAAASLLKPIVDMDEGQLLKILSKPNDQYELLIPKASEEQIKKIELLGLKGVHIGSKKDRLYPFGDLASHVLGFVGLTKEDDVAAGRYGIELFREEILRGIPSSYDALEGLSESVDGKDVHLTVNRDVQARAEEVLSDLVSTYKASGGSVIVQNPKTGAILAMASNPSFDPNNYSKADVSEFVNPAIEGIYEPGSIFKIITMASGLDSGAFDPSTVYHDIGEVTLNGRTIKNWDLKAHGDVTMTGAIEGSINTALVYAESLIGHETFYAYLNKFGLKEKTGIGLPNEAHGSLAPLEEVGRDINFATAAFGQGVSVTPIRLISILSAIANDGMMMEPYINARRSPKSQRRVVSKEAADLVTEMMVSAVKKNYLADIKNYDVAGKTGTAQVPDFVNGGYLDFDEAVINTYIGFAPANNPVFTVMIKLDKPRGAPLAGQTVVPAFKELAEFLLNYYAVPPDYID